MKTDLFLYIGCAFFAYIAQYLGTDDAAKFIDAVTLFYLRMFAGALSGSCLAAKMFRSNVFSNHQDAMAGLVKVQGPTAGASITDTRTISEVQPVNPPETQAQPKVNP